MRVKNTKQEILMCTNETQYEIWCNKRINAFFKIYNISNLKDLYQSKLNFINKMMIYLFYIFILSIYLRTLFIIDNFYINILTIIQIFTVIIKFVVFNYEEKNIKQYHDNNQKYLFYKNKIYRLYFIIDVIFNVILDYTYYPIAIIWILVN